MKRGIGYRVSGIGLTASLLASVLSVADSQDAVVEPKAAAVMRNVEHATLAARSLEADLTVTRIQGSKRQRLSGTARLMRNRFAKMVLKGTFGQTVASDGLNLWVYNASTDQYIKKRMEPGQRVIARAFGPLLPLAMFFDPRRATASTPKGARIRLYSPVVNGGRMDVVALIAPGIEIRLFVGPSGLIQRSLTTVTRGTETSSIDTELTNVKLNKAFSKHAFSYEPPRTSRELPGPIEVEVVQPSGKQKER